jgi:hypothetical protein
MRQHSGLKVRNSLMREFQLKVKHQFSSLPDRHFEIQVDDVR